MPGATAAWLPSVHEHPVEAGISQPGRRDRRLGVPDADLTATGMWEESRCARTRASAFRPGSTAASPSAGCDRSSHAAIAGIELRAEQIQPPLGRLIETRPPAATVVQTGWVAEAENRSKMCFEPPLPMRRRRPIGEASSQGHRRARRRHHLPGTISQVRAGESPDRARSLHWPCLRAPAAQVPWPRVMHKPQFSRLPHRGPKDEPDPPAHKTRGHARSGLNGRIQNPSRQWRRRGAGAQDFPGQPAPPATNTALGGSRAAEGFDQIEAGRFLGSNLPRQTAQQERAGSIAKLYWRRPLRASR